MFCLHVHLIYSSWLYGTVHFFFSLCYFINGDLLQEMDIQWSQTFLSHVNYRVTRILMHATDICCFLEFSLASFSDMQYLKLFGRSWLPKVLEDCIRASGPPLWEMYLKLWFRLVFMRVFEGGFYLVCEFLVLSIGRHFLQESISLTYFM